MAASCKVSEHPLMCGFHRLPPALAFSCTSSEAVHHSAWVRRETGDHGSVKPRNIAGLITALILPAMFTACSGRFARRSCMLRQKGDSGRKTAIPDTALAGCGTDDLMDRNPTSLATRVGFVLAGGGLHAGLLPIQVF